MKGSALKLPEESAALIKERYNVGGMTCSACSAHVEKSVSKLNGVSKAEVNLLTNSMTVEYDGRKCQRSYIITAVEHGGYTASLPSSDALKGSEEKR